MTTQDNPPSQQGSMNITAGQDLTVGGDIVARDKIYIANQIVIVSEGQTDKLLSEVRRLIEEAKPEITHSQRVSRKPKQPYNRSLIYQLNLSGTHQEISDALNKWRFVQAVSFHLTGKQPLAVVANEVIGVGENYATTFHSPPIQELYNCGIECDLRIIDDGGDASRWAGFRVRGFHDDIQFGYLIYLRRRGTVELYRARQVIGGENQIIISDTKDAWTNIRLDIINSQIKVWVNGKLHINVRDKTFGNKGMVYLHTFGTHAQFRNFQIYRLTH